MYCCRPCRSVVLVPFGMEASVIASATTRRQVRDRGQQRPPHLRPARQLQGTGKRVETGQEPKGEFFVVAMSCAAAEGAHVGAAEVVFGMDRDGRPLAVAILAIAPPSGH